MSSHGFQPMESELKQTVLDPEGVHQIPPAAIAQCYEEKTHREIGYRHGGRSYRRLGTGVPRDAGLPEPFHHPQMTPMATDYKDQKMYVLTFLSSV